MCRPCAAALTRRYQRVIEAYSAAPTGVTLTDVDFQVLGPLAASDERGPLPLEGPRVRALLAYLLLHANTPRSTADLLDELWGDDLPSTGATAVQNAVARLRKVLGVRIVTSGGGYLVRVEPGELDLHRFHDTVEQAATAAPETRARLLRDALALWHGEPLGSLPDAPFVARERARLDGERLAALNDRIDADLALGRHAALVPELSALAAEHPLDERFRAQLILALYRCGRQAAALDVYRETRENLAEEVGLEPSPALRDLQRAVLQQDPALDAPPAAAAARPARPRPTRRLLWAAGVAALFAAGTASAIVLSRDDPQEAAQAATTSTSAPSAHRPIVAATSTQQRPAPRRPDRRPRRHAVVIRPVTVHAAPTTTAQPHASSTTAPVTPTPATTTIPTHRQKKAARPPTTVTRERPTTTRPAQVTKPKPAPTAPAATPTTERPAGPPLVDDAFDGPVDDSFWHPAILGEGPQVAQRNGRVEMFLPASATPYGTYRQIAGQYEVRCKFPGDFDAQVDFDLVQWPPGNGVSATLSATIEKGKVAPYDIYPQIFRRSLGDQEHYQSAVILDESVVPTEDRQGRLRIARRNNIFATYYWKRQRWVAVDSAKLPGTAAIAFATITNGNEWGRLDVTVAFDNFVLYASRADCG